MMIFEIPIHSFPYLPSRKTRGFFFFGNWASVPLVGQPVVVKAKWYSWWWRVSKVRFLFFLTLPPTLELERETIEFNFHERGILKERKSCGGRCSLIGMFFFFLVGWLVGLYVVVVVTYFSFRLYFTVFSYLCLYPPPPPLPSPVPFLVLVGCDNVVR